MEYKNNNIVKGDKKLYHLQSMEICSEDSAFDIFVFADHEPTKEDIIKFLKNEFYESDYNEEEYNKMADTFEVYRLYAEEI